MHEHEWLAERFEDTGGQPRVVFAFTIAGGKIVEIELIADPERIGRLNVTILK
jgi:RNA polymerase sigma-70 factor, ECF subfamily